MTVMPVPEPKNSPMKAQESTNQRGQRVFLVFGIFTFIAVFQWMYVHYLYPNWDYFGFHYEPPALSYLVLAWVLSVVPSLWMPMKLRRPSQLAYWVLYVMVFIPSMFVPLYVGLTPPKQIAELMVVLFAGLAITGTSYLVPLIRVRPPKISRALFWKGFACVAMALTLWMVVVFRNHLQIVSFLDVSELRSIQEDVSEGKLVSYAFMWLSGAINPFLMGWGLYYRRRWVFLAGALGQLLVYSVGATKGSILSILFISTFYVLLRVGRLPFGQKLTFGALALLGGVSLSYVLAGYEPGPLQTIVLFVVLMRVFSVSGLMTAWYYDFFQHNPYTYYSHVKGVSSFAHYPFQHPIGQEIGLAYMGTTDLDANAPLWATDGIGALGLPGVLIASVFCALVFWILDSASQRHDPRLAALVTMFAALNIANIPLFTSLLSGGLGFLILSLYLMPSKASSNFKAKKYVAKRGLFTASRGRTAPIPG